MKNDHFEFTVIAQLAALALGCLVGIAVLVIVENVTKDNSFGIEGIIEALKSIASGLVGGAITLARQTPAATSATVTPTNAAPAAGDKP